MINIIGKRKYWYSLSAIFAISAILFIAIWGLNLGLDFKGGSLLTLKFSSTVNVESTKEVLGKYDLKSVSVQSLSGNKIVIRSSQIDQKTKEAISNDLKIKIGPFDEENFQTIGPTVSRDLTTKAIVAVVLASIAIILYIAFAFRGVPKPASSWRFGVCAIIALLHDLLIVTGAAALVGHFASWMVIDSLFITALLTILGFSVHDTIVVFDRFRENLKRNPGRNFETIANESVVQTLSRSVNTSVTTVLVLLSLFLLGGESVKGFVFTLLFGIIIGTYSSIFNATPLLVSWQLYGKKS